MSHCFSREFHASRHLRKPLSTLRDSQATLLLLVDSRNCVGDSRHHLDAYVRRATDNQHGQTDEQGSDQQRNHHPRQEGRTAFGRAIVRDGKDAAAALPKSLRDRVDDRICIEAQPACIFNCARRKLATDDEVRAPRTGDRRDSSCETVTRSSLGIPTQDAAARIRRLYA